MVEPLRLQWAAYHSRRHGADRPDAGAAGREECGRIWMCKASGPATPPPPSRHRGSSCRSRTRSARRTRGRSPRRGRPPNQPHPQSGQPTGHVVPSRHTGGRDGPALCMSQHTDPAVHPGEHISTVQVLPKHIGVDPVQWCEHAPQLSGSLLGLTQLPPQHVSPAVHTAPDPHAPPPLSFRASTPVPTSAGCTSTAKPVSTACASTPVSIGGSESGFASTPAMQQARHRGS